MVVLTGCTRRNRDSCHAELTTSLGARMRPFHSSEWHGRCDVHPPGKCSTSARRRRTLGRRRSSMRRGTVLGTLSLIALLLLNGCASAPPAPADAVVVTADARALQYGSNAPEVLNNPRVANQIRALFGPDWNPSA